MSETLQITTPSPRETRLTRVFNAPPRLVYRAFTEPALVQRWCIPAGGAITVCDMDVRPGGHYRHVLRIADGREMGIRGTYRELVPGERIVHEEFWEDWNPGLTLVTTTFTPHGEGTLMHINMEYPSQEVRDIIMKNGLEHAAGPLYEQMATLLADLRAG